ncbi:Gfo/Idh/MocA family protein [Paenibacillus beijingensis]|uniref:Oxidoreductase n=1 Tax=Paenibacillus beijingensis TaxID=1126833 RepID=A0A0D5NNP7_9BACL|nr:Gfo/Idh/MocA family oxidoreductase [Paenibacillus beijingensis]AJY76896.1 oxidoreductase [Paenibacillus beijingensis]
MKQNKIGVGIIGASSDGSWGGIAHLPALQALSNFRVTAVSTTRQASAAETASRFGIPHAFTDPYELALHPDVDLVTVAVKVPEHDKLVRTALKAGKHVYCEYPLGRTTEEATGLLQAAEEKGVRHFVGLQARTNPALTYVKDLIAGGYIGNVRAVHCNYALPVYSTRSKQINQSRVYLLDEANGANQLTITAGHLLDGITYLVGSFSEVSAILETQAKQVKVVETDEVIQATSPDHVIVNGILANGAIMSTHIRNTHIGSLSLEINGTEGDLRLQSKENFMFQIDSFVVKGAQGSNKKVEELPIPPQYNRLPSELNGGPAFNVAQLYSQIYTDLLENTHQAPDFRTAEAVHELLDKIRIAAKTGLRQKV